MAEMPGLMLWTDSWLADTAHLDHKTRDIYLHWLILMWRTPGCRTPNDLDWVARKLRCLSELPTLEAIKAEFLTSSGNWLTQKRLTLEWENAMDHRNKQTARAKARWDKEKGVCRGNASISNPSPSKDITLTSFGESAKVHQLFPAKPEPWIPDDEVPAPPPKPKPKPLPEAKRGTRCPENYQPTDKDFNEACMWLGEETVRWEHKKFKDYWRGAPGARGVKLNWDATWRNWMRKVLDGRRDRG